MNKTYIKPQTKIVAVNVCGRILEGSVGIYSTTADTGSFVKEESSSTRDSYNVWDDDWSK